MWQVTTAFLKPDSGKYLGVSQNTLDADTCCFGPAVLHDNLRLFFSPLSFHKPDVTGGQNPEWVQLRRSPFNIAWITKRLHPCQLTRQVGTGNSRFNIDIRTSHVSGDFWICHPRGMEVKKKQRNNMEILKGVGVAKRTTWTPKHFNNIPKEWRSSGQVKTNKATPKKFYLEYSKDPKISRFVFHPKTGPYIFRDPLLREHSRETTPFCSTWPLWPKTILMVSTFVSGERHPRPCTWLTWVQKAITLDESVEAWVKHFTGSLLSKAFCLKPYSIVAKCMSQQSETASRHVAFDFSGACKTQIACLGASEFYSHQIPLTLLSLWPDYYLNLTLRCR